MYCKSVFVTRTFETGVAVGSLRAFLAHAGAGELVITRDQGDILEVELRVSNPLIMRYAEEQLAAFV